MTRRMISSRNSQVNYSSGSSQQSTSSCSQESLRNIVKANTKKAEKNDLKKIKTTSGKFYAK